MKPRTLLLAAALAASACATAPKGGAAAGAAATDSRPAVLTDSQGRRYRVVCRMERPTGSNISEKVCRTVPESADPSNSEIQDALVSPNVGRAQTRTGI
jgi:hypothetical protein